MGAEPANKADFQIRWVGCGEATTFSAKAPGRPKATISDPDEAVRIPAHEESRAILTAVGLKGPRHLPSPSRGPPPHLDISSHSARSQGPPPRRIATSPTTRFAHPWAPWRATRPVSHSGFPSLRIHLVWTRYHGLEAD